MVEIEFNYLQDKTIIQANLNDPFSKIISNFINKTQLDLNNLCFLSNGKNLNKSETINQIISDSEKRNKKMTILVQSLDNTINISNNIIQSNDIICPSCKEICKLEIKNHRIKLYGCKNGHIKENIKFQEFNSTQKIDLKKIKCNKCNKTKNEIFNHEFYICCECSMNLCPLCKSLHDKTHSMINYDNKNYVCNKHDETLFKYCEDCNLDLCLSCTEGHKNHKIISYEDRLVNIKDLRKQMNDLNTHINMFKKKFRRNNKKNKEYNG